MHSKHPYVPVLRWKGAETSAVRDLTNEQRDHMQPLFEFVPHAFAGLPLERAVALQARDIASNWGWTRPCYIDPSHLGLAAAAAVYALLDKEEYLTAIPVISLQPALAAELLRDLTIVGRRGLAIRINAHEFRQSGWRDALSELVAKLRLPHNQIDLIIDFGVIQKSPGSYSRAVDSVSELGDWRQIVLLAGSFPVDLSKLKKNEVHPLIRHEWLAYSAFVRKGGSAAFGDYTIQHGVFKEHEGKFPNFSASIRYTHSNHIIVMRGESVQSDAGYEQWPANAQLLSEMQEFKGKEFSAGDAYIATMGAQQENNGTAKDWLAAGINHHLCFVLNQLEHFGDQPVLPDESEVTVEWPARMHG